MVKYNCPKCNSEVLSTAVCCHNCGYDLLFGHEKENKISKTLKTFWAILTFVLATAISASIFGGENVFIITAIKLKKGGKCPTLFTRIGIKNCLFFLKNFVRVKPWLFLCHSEHLKTVDFFHLQYNTCDIICQH